ncbi:MAG: tRNA adenosine(34) deaminase TadA [Desulfohalobiaceae bacterium]
MPHPRGTGNVPPPGNEGPWTAAMETAMETAMEEAAMAFDMQEVPIGAVLLDRQGSLVARTHNQSIALHDPTAHAEILALRQGGKLLGNYRLSGTTLVVTLEPCLMCLGAMVHARIARLVFGATDPKSGAVISRLRGTELPWLNHRIEVVGGVMEQECGELLREFFRKKRR